MQAQNGMPSGTSMTSTTPAARAAAPELTAAEAALIVAFAEVATPAGVHIAAPDDALVGRVASALGGLGARFAGEYPKMLHALDLAALPLSGKRLSQLPVGRR